MYEARPPPKREGGGGGRHTPRRPPGRSNKRQADEDDEDDFDHNKERKVVKGIKKNKNRDSIVSATSVDSDGFAKIRKHPSPKGEDLSFDENRKRIEIKDYQTDFAQKQAMKKPASDRKGEKFERPMKENNYLNRRMSDLLRGENPEIDLDKILFTAQHKELAEVEPHGLIERINLVYRKKMSEKKMVPRAILCALAVTLLWATSVSACRGIIYGFIPAPSYNDVETVILNLENVTTTEEEGYESCVNLEFSTCNSTYVTDRDKEIARVKAVQDANTDQLSQSDTISTNCGNAYSAMINKLEEYADENLNLGGFVISGDSACAALEEITSDQLKALSAVDTSKNAADSSKDTIDEYQKQLDERTAYDEAYKNNVTNGFTDKANTVNENLFTGEDFETATKNQLNQLKACMGNGFFTDEETGETFKCDEASTAQQAAAYLQKYEDQYASLSSEAQEYIDSVNKAVDDVNRIANAASVVDPAILEQFGFNTNLPPVDTAQLQAELISQLSDLGISQERFEETIRNAQDAYADNLTAIEAQLDDLADQIKANQTAYINSLNEEFTPPQNDAVTNTAENAKAQADALSGQIEQDLGAVNLDTDNLPDATNVSSLADTDAANLLVGLNDRPFEAFSYPASMFTDVKVGLGRIVQLALVFDSVWRVLHSIMLVRKYWNISAIATPPGDVTSEKSALFKEKQNALQKVGKILGNPLLHMIFSLFILLLLSMLFYVAYIPIFDEYVVGCTEHTAQQIRDDPSVTGTMLYRNMLTASQSIAFSKGDAATSNLVDKLNLQRQLSCREFFEASVKTRNDQNDTFTDLKSDMDLINQRYDLFNNCVDWDRFQTQAATVAQVVNDQDFKTQFATPECHEPITEIDVTDNALHNCVNIAFCNISCTGPIEDRLLDANHAAACTSEYAFHAYFLIGLFATVMFICLNMARFYFLRGIVEVAWPHLGLDIHTYLASCTERGTIIPPEEVEDGEYFNFVIESALDIALARFTRKGYWDLFYSIAINIPWIVFMTVISKNIDYNELESS